MNIQKEVYSMKTVVKKEDAVKNAIPEFLKYNIVENEVRNVI